MRRPRPGRAGELKTVAPEISTATGSRRANAIARAKDLANHPIRRSQPHALEFLRTIPDGGLGNPQGRRRNQAISAIVDQLRQLPESERGSATHGS